MSARSNWVSSVLLCCAPIIAIGVITLCGAIFYEPHGCGRPSPRSRATADITSIYCATVEFAMNNGGHFPKSIDELVEPDALGYRYLNQKSRPQDPWGRTYIYMPPGENETAPNVISLGEDGEVGGDGDDRDLDVPTLLMPIPDH